MNQELNELRWRALGLAKKYNLSHMGSTFSTLPALHHIYFESSLIDEDIVILSSGHAGLALYVTLEKKYGFDAEKLLNKNGIHPKYDPEYKIYCTTGSLGIGITAAVGYALTGKDVYCVISDGECSEGSVWEALSFIDDKELPVSVNVVMNGMSAYQMIDSYHLANKLKTFLPSITIWNVSNFPFSDDISSHYINVNESHEKTLKIYNEW